MKVFPSDTFENGLNQLFKFDERYFFFICYYAEKISEVLRTLSNCNMVKKGIKFVIMQLSMSFRLIHFVTLFQLTTQMIYKNLKTLFKIIVISDNFKQTLKKNPRNYLFLKISYSRNPLMQNTLLEIGNDLLCIGIIMIRSGMFKTTGKGIKPSRH